MVKGSLIESKDQFDKYMRRQGERDRLVWIEGFKYGVAMYARTEASAIKAAAEQAYDEWVKHGQHKELGKS